ncbi:helix-turn-helix domain-containing protein [Devosia sp. SL43]|uniref:helix-turn-helix domain-containing protein n=1 Tax=Devosia sp. SL43 TaxID=2806348 RepID=UPI001F1CA838|nr:helix-turn-helix domain-containing protein [Devosia sp. SL43]UJW86900.1 helix-turn-helix domain-containing protein [Devosia sp. SL43]
MDSLINAAALSLAAGDVVGALKRVALRDDPPALALRGIAMAQLGDFERARALLKAAGRGFGKAEVVARARCVVAEAEIALVSRDLGWPVARLSEARAELLVHGDRHNGAHAISIEARRCLLLGQLTDAASALAQLEPERLSPALLAGFHLVSAGIAARQTRANAARLALDQAQAAATLSGIPALIGEVQAAKAALDMPVGVLIREGNRREVTLDGVEALLESGTLVVDATRNGLRLRDAVVSLSGRPVLFALLRALAEAWPGDVSREGLLRQAFGAKEADESHRARLRVEMARLRQAIGSFAEVSATSGGFILASRTGKVVLLASPLDGYNAAIMAMLGDGELWSSSALALALGTSARSVQRALAELEASGKAQPVGQGRARRWTLVTLPGFPTTLLLPQSG